MLPGVRKQSLGKPHYVWEPKTRFVLPLRTEPRFVSDEHGS